MQQWGSWSIRTTGTLIFFLNTHISPDIHTTYTDGRNCYQGNLALKNSIPLLAKDDGKESRVVDLKHTHRCGAHTKANKGTALYGSCKFSKYTCSTYIRFCHEVQSEPRLTEKLKCINARGQGRFLSHGFLHSIHSRTLGARGDGRETEWEITEKGLSGKSRSLPEKSTFNHLPNLLLHALTSPYPSTPTCWQSDVSEQRQSVISLSFKDR